MIIFDYSQMVIFALNPFFGEIADDTKESIDIGRHAILNSIKFTRNKFRDIPGKVVIACDGRSYWRKDIFPYYKHGRAEARKESSIPWDMVHKISAIVRDELYEHSPYIVIHNHKAEADDIMGTLVHHVSTKRLVKQGLEEVCEPTILVSWDGDMKQLQIDPNIKQYSPKDGKYVKCPEGATAYLRNKILVGDGGDGICNVFSPNTSFVTKTRQKSATKPKLEAILAFENLVDGTSDVNIKKRIIENEQLVSLQKIPEWLVEEIVASYDAGSNGNKMKLYKYLAENRCKLLMEEIDKF